MKKDNFDVAIIINFGVLLRFQVGHSLCVIPKWALQELEGVQKVLLSFKCGHLERAPTNNLHLSFQRASPT